MSKHNLDSLFKQLEDLTIKQEQFEKSSNQWLQLEKQVIITQCFIFNKITRMQEEIPDFAIILSLISIHLITYIEEDKFLDELKHLTLEAKVMMYYVLDHITKDVFENEQENNENE